MTPPVAAEPSAAPSQRRKVFLHRLAQRHPFVYWFLLVVLSNAAASLFNFEYNLELIVHRLMDERQQAVFWQAAFYYNIIAYPLCLGLMLVLIVPLAGCRRRMRCGDGMAAADLEYCRRRVVNFPLIQVVLNFLGWIPGAIYFPAVVCGLGGGHEAHEIWTRFIISFVISAVYATVQTFFLMEWFLVAVMYPELFRDARPAEVPGRWPIPFVVRMLFLWLAVAVMPLVAVTAMACYSEPGQQMATLAVAVTGFLSGLLIFGVVGNDIQHWIQAQAAATAAIAQENFAVRVAEQRPDEWGRLSDGFNDMAAALGRGQEMREAFGQFVSPEVRDEILRNYPGLDVAIQEITVLFVDIRGFTSRCAGAAPQHVGRLLNRFFTLALEAIEVEGGWVNKFLGDGVLALFGAPRARDNHADLAVASARELLRRLEVLNDELAREGQPPLQIGIGIHTGSALVGCFGATLAPADGPQRFRKEFSAIGETVNLGQRIEQMTKQLGGPILVSDATRSRLHRDWPLVDRGPHALPGAPEAVRLFRIDAAI